MLNSGMLDVAIGLIFVFFLVSLLCSAIREALEAWLKTRATYLERAIRELLHDRQGQGLARSVFQHPLVFGLFRGDYVSRNTETWLAWRRGKNLPSYIPARSVALALIDIAARGPSTDAASSDPGMAPITVATLRESVRNLQNPPVQRVLLTAIDIAGQDGLEAVQSQLEAWYDESMERVSGWYRRTTQWVLLGIALLVVGALNIDTLRIADYLYRNDAARSQVVAAAQHASGTMSYEQAIQELEGLSLPIGWGSPNSEQASPAVAKLPTEAAPSTGPDGSASRQGVGAPTAHSPKTEPSKLDRFWNDYIARALGLLITALAAMLGAPFWFDVLSKVSTLRATQKTEPATVDAVPADRERVWRQANLIVRRQAANDQRRSARSSDIAPRGSSGQSEEDLEACDIPIEEATPDERLPPAKGGVAI